MTHINLLPDSRRAAASPVRSLTPGQRMTLVGTLILVVAAALVGWRFWALHAEAAQLTLDIEEGRREEVRLADVLTEVQRFETQRTQLQQRVALIDELRKGQTAPVHMIDQVSRALPEMTWLTSIRQEGYDLILEGRCLSLTALSDFVANLEASRYFKRPVEIVNSEVMSRQQAGPDVIRFTVRGTFQMTGIELPPPPAGRGPARRGNRG